MLENVLTIIAGIDSILFFPVAFKIFNTISYEEQSDLKDLAIYTKILAVINLPILFI